MADDRLCLALSSIDSICSLALHPLRPLLLSTSGSRHWAEDRYARGPAAICADEGSVSDSSCSASSSEGATLIHEQEHHTLPAVRGPKCWSARDAKLVLWEAS